MMRMKSVYTLIIMMLAYLFTGISAGIAAVFWSSSFVTVASATGNGMELDAIAGVYIGGTSTTGGSASVLGTILCSATASPMISPMGIRGDKLE